eukprot:3626612-Amphidinium_carterae.1
MESHFEQESGCSFLTWRGASSGHFAPAALLRRGRCLLKQLRPKHTTHDTPQLSSHTAQIAASGRFNAG